MARDHHIDVYIHIATPTHMCSREGPCRHSRIGISLGGGAPGSLFGVDASTEPLAVLYKLRKAPSGIEGTRAVTTSTNVPGFLETPPLP